MQKLPPHISAVASVFLFCLGLMDLFRGLAHTFLIYWANDTFAHLDLSSNGQDQLMLLGAFGISNWLTGFIFILVAIKARNLAETVLAFILLAYAVGYMGLQYAGVTPESDFNGRYIMFVYFAVCAVGIIWSKIANKRIAAQASHG
jgi:hypothetical protein